MTSPDLPGDEPDMRLDPKIQDAIGRSLKAHYDDLISAPVPDKFLLLLAQLEVEERKSAAADGSHEQG